MTNCTNFALKIYKLCKSFGRAFRKLNIVFNFGVFVFCVIYFIVLTNKPLVAMKMQMRLHEEETFEPK